MNRAHLDSPFLCTSVTVPLLAFLFIVFIFMEQRRKFNALRGLVEAR